MSADSTSLKQGHVRVHLERGGAVPLESSRFAFYVDPESGRLQVNAAFVSERERARQREARRQAELHERMRLSGNVQAHKIGGAWYAVDLQPLPVPTAQRRGGAVPVIDAVLGRAVDASDRFELLRLYGKRGIYGARKRELSYREQRELGLAERA